MSPPLLYGVELSPEQAAQVHQYFAKSGRKGGLAKSKRKTRAARRNACKPRPNARGKRKARQLVPAVASLVVPAAPAGR